MTPPWPSKVDLLNPPKMNTCPKCRALLDPADKVCEYCGTSLKHLNAPSETMDLRRAMGIFTWILTVNFLMFMLTIALDRHQEEEGAFEPSSAVMLAFGSNYAPLVLEEGQYWRLVSSGFLPRVVRNALRPARNRVSATFEHCQQERHNAQQQLVDERDEVGHEQVQ